MYLLTVFNGIGLELLDVRFGRFFKEQQVTMCKPLVFIGGGLPPSRLGTLPSLRSDSPFLSL